jgi:hypothetical protein
MTKGQMVYCRGEKCVILELEQHFRLLGSLEAAGMERVGLSYACGDRVFFCCHRKPLYSIFTWHPDEVLARQLTP